MNSCISCFWFEQIGGCWTEKSSPKSIIKLPGNNSTLFALPVPQKTIEGSPVGEKDVVPLSLQLPHHNIHKSILISIYSSGLCPGDTKQGWFEILSLIPDQQLLPTTVAKFSLFFPVFFFLLLKLLTFRIFSLQNFTSLQLLLFLDLADIDPISGEGRTEQT